MNDLNIKIPILQEENIQGIIDSCIKKDGLNRRHSRTIEPLKYRQPVKGTLSKEKEDKLAQNISIDIFKYYCNKCLKILNKNKCDLSKPVVSFINNFNNDEIIGYDLIKISKCSNEELLKIINKPCITPYEKFLYAKLKPNKINAERYDSSFLYKDLKKDDVEEEAYGFNPHYSKRIYMNLPQSSSISYKFAITFIERCIDKDIPFNMKLFGSFSHSENDLDSTIFYSKNAYFEEHIKILREILNDYPEYKQFIGSPITTAGNIIEDDNRSYLAISHSGYTAYYGKCGKTYNDTSDEIINMAYVYSCCKIIKYYYAYFINKLDQNTLKEIKVILNNELSTDSIEQLRKIEEPVRKAIYEFYNNKKSNYESIDYTLGEHIKENITSFSSIINFGDLEHKDYPIYENTGFKKFHNNDYTYSYN